MAEWLTPCNIAEYDIIGAFKKFKKLNWKQSTNIQIGDVVYIYIGKPYSAIKYKCYVRKTNLSSAEIDDSEYVIDGTNYSSHGRYLELEFLQKFSTTLLERKKLMENGLKQIQGPHRITNELSCYINYVTGSLLNDMEDDELLNEVNQHIQNYTNPAYTYRGVEKQKATPIIKNGQKIYPRDRQTAINALVHANYCCEIDSTHPSFLRKNSGTNYTEPHHLVPLSFSEQFDVSLDVEENIVSLCSNCHNQIHYGEDAHLLIKKLYEERKEHLEQVGIKITLTELLKMYC